MGSTLSLVAPLVDLAPTPCFSIDTYKVYDSVSNEPVTEYLSVSGDGTIDIVTSDRALVGVHRIYVMTAVLESGEEVQRQDLTLTIIDSCETTLLTGSFDLELISTAAGSSEKLEETLDAFSDSISDSVGRANNCGAISYSLKLFDGDPAPSFVQLTYAEGESTFKITVDAADLSAVQTLDLVFEAELVDYYPQVPRVTNEFKLAITELVEPWVPPPPPEETPKEPDPPEPVIEDEEEEEEPVPATPAPVFVFKPVVKVNEQAEKAAGSIRESVNEN